MKTIYYVSYGQGGRQLCRTKAELSHFIALLTQARDGCVTVTVTREQVKSVHKSKQPA